MREQTVLWFDRAQCLVFGNARQPAAPPSPALSAGWGAADLAGVQSRQRPGSPVEGSFQLGAAAGGGPSQVAGDCGARRRGRRLGADHCARLLPGHTRTCACCQNKSHTPPFPPQVLNCTRGCVGCWAVPASLGRQAYAVYLRQLLPRCCHLSWVGAASRLPKCAANACLNYNSFMSSPCRLGRHLRICSSHPLCRHAGRSLPGQGSICWCRPSSPARYLLPAHRAALRGHGSAVPGAPLDWRPALGRVHRPADASATRLAQRWSADGRTDGGSRGCRRGRLHPGVPPQPARPDSKYPARRAGAAAAAHSGSVLRLCVLHARRLARRSARCCTGHWRLARSASKRGRTGGTSTPAHRGWV